MTEDTARPASREQTAGARRQAPPPPARSWFRLPPAIRRVFDKFPLVTYSTNSLPQRTNTTRDAHVLYLFSTSRSEEPSCNPSCLKYQAYLLFRGIPFRSQPSNNHASPTGALPFVLQAEDSISRPKSPVAANKITRWVVSQGGEEDTLHMKEEAYMSLIDHTIRNAWLYYLYLDRANFNAVAWPLYVKTASSNYFVQQAISRQLRSAAQDELLKTSSFIDAAELCQHADEAFHALSTQLGQSTYFFDSTTPGLFDASLFAYTHLLLDSSFPWQTQHLTDLLSKFPNLVQHRDHILSKYFNR
jgi:metaxin